MVLLDLDGEHGIGTGKIEFLPRELGGGHGRRDAFDQACADPRNLMYSGKIFDGARM